MRNSDSMNRWIERETVEYGEISKYEVSSIELNKMKIFIYRLACPFPGIGSSAWLTFFEFPNWIIHVQSDEYINIGQGRAKLYCLEIKFLEYTCTWALYVYFVSKLFGRRLFLSFLGRHLEK